MKNISETEHHERKNRLTENIASDKDCRVFWGMHGCYKTRGHNGSHECTCGAVCYEIPGTEAFGLDL
jgi:hypothetical protein